MPHLSQYRFFLWVLLFLAGFSLLARCAVHLVSHNYNISAEANGLYGVLEVGEAKPLYAPRDVRPYAIHLYPPVYAFFSGTLLRALGPQSLHARVIFVRGLSFLTLCLVLFLLYRLFLRQKNLAAVVVCFVGVVALSKFADYATASRNDMMSLLWDLAALGALLQWRRRRQDLWLCGLLVASLLSFYTRQTGIAVFGAMMLWLLSLREYRRAVSLSLAYVALVAVIFWGLDTMTHGAFVEQVFLANLRGFRPLNHQFFDPSMVSFLLTYVLFVALVARGVRLTWAWREPELRLLLLSAGASLLLSAGVFMRAGGDVNYFFESILFGSVFAAMAVQDLFNRFKGSFIDWSWRGAFVVQLVLIGGLCTIKAYSAYQVAFLPYESLAARVRTELPAFGYLIGTGSQNMGIHLRGWAIYGPDVTNSGYVAKNAHPRFRGLIKDLLRDVLLHKVHSMVMVDPLCQKPYRRLRGTYGKQFPIAEDWEPWFCVYRDAVSTGGLTLQE